VNPASPLPHEGPLAGADAVGASGSMSSGPGVRVALHLAADVIVDARFEACDFESARPVAEALCALLLGRTIRDATRLTVLDVAQIGSVPPTSPAARTVHFAKSAAILPFAGRRARDGTALTCTCFHIPRHEIVEAIRLGRVRSVEELRARMPATTGCGCCRPEVQRLIEQHSEPAGEAPSGGA
jgi:bacterioferritin-associated ferredoxin/NifU-like protein involved in Fe-S cluster formation